MRDTALIVRLRQLASTAPMVVAHRGNSGAFPENTLPAFASAIEAGAAMIEFDVRETRDGVVVCIHDATLDRTTDVTTSTGQVDVEVEACDAATLATLDAGRWKGEHHAGARVPSLATALELMRGRVVPMIEHKAGRPETLVALLQRLDLVDHVLVQSFDWDLVARVGALEPRLTLGALGEGALTAPRYADLPRTDASLVHWDVHDLRAEDVERLRRDGYTTCVYTANSDVELAGAAALGVDAITTNHPNRLQHLLAHRVIRAATPRG